MSVIREAIPVGLDAFDLAIISQYGRVIGYKLIKDEGGFHEYEIHIGYMQTLRYLKSNTGGSILEPQEDVDAPLSEF